MSGVFALWAERYGEEPNPLLRLADRALAQRLGDLKGLRVLDAGCGTGRWTLRAAETGAKALGLDRERAMLAHAPAGLVVEGELARAPFASEAFDLALAAFSLSYAESPAAALAELCALVKTGGRIVAADLHPDAVEAGWRRTFRYGGRTIEVPSRVEELERALQAPGPGWRIDLLDSHRFGELERTLFEADHWARVRDVWALRLAVWLRFE